MIFVESSVELINETDNFKRIERAGRISYKSEDKITEDSAYPFFQRMCKNGHTSTLEHSVIYVRSHDPGAYMKMQELLREYVENTGYPHYIRYSNWDHDDTVYQSNDLEYGEGYPMGICLGKEHLFSGNIRAWRKLCEKYGGENILCDLFYDHPAFHDIFVARDIKLYGKELGNEDKIYTKDVIEIVDSIPLDRNEFEYAYIHYPVTLKIVGDRGVIDEYARHRSCGITIESSRYVNYSKNGVTFVFPWWFTEMKDSPKYASLAGDFGNRCYDTELAYQEWIKKCNIPQMARGNLTLWVKSEGAFTATVQQWIDILKLRDAAGAHPDAQKIAKMIEKVLVEDVGVEDIWGVKGNDGLSHNTNTEE